MVVGLESETPEQEFRPSDGQREALLSGYFSGFCLKTPLPRPNLARRNSQCAARRANRFVCGHMRVFSEGRAIQELSDIALPYAVRRDRSSSVPRGIVAASPCGTTSEYSLIQEQQQITRLQRVLRRSASAQSQRKGAVAPCSWTPQESQVERCEHQDDSNIHCQPFPESVSEEHEIYTDYDGCHRHHVKHDSYLSAHFSPWFNCNSKPQDRV